MHCLHHFLSLSLSVFLFFGISLAPTGCKHLREQLSTIEEQELSRSPRVGAARCAPTLFLDFTPQTGLSAPESSVMLNSYTSGYQPFNFPNSLVSLISPSWLYVQVWSPQNTIPSLLAKILPCFYWHSHYSMLVKKCVGEVYIIISFPPSNFLSLFLSGSHAHLSGVNPSH
jgi:hypothetical protein